MSTLRLLMTADTVGGVWNYALELTRALAPHGVEVHLATMGAGLAADQWEVVRALPTLTLHESRFRLEWMEDPWDDVERAGAWLLGLQQALRPDIVHLNGYAHGALPFGVPVLVAGHSCVLSWWEAVRGEAAPPAWRPYAEAVRRGLAGAGVVVTPTRAMRDALAHHYGPLPSSEVIPNASDPHRFRPASKEPFVLTVGRGWDEAKNIAALAGVAEALPWPIFVAGELQHPEGGTAPLGGLHGLGRLAPDDLAGWYGRAAVYALPARYEPFGLSVLEGALAGCALVLGDIGSLRELWDGAALFVPPDDHAVLRAALGRLLEDTVLRESLAARAQERAQGYSPQRMAARYLATYQRLLTRQG